MEFRVLRAFELGSCEASAVRSCGKQYSLVVESAVKPVP